MPFQPERIQGRPALYFNFNRGNSRLKHAHIRTLGHGWGGSWRCRAASCQAQLLLVGDLYDLLGQRRRGLGRQLHPGDALCLPRTLRGGGHKTARLI